MALLVVFVSFVLFFGLRLRVCLRFGVGFDFAGFGRYTLFPLYPDNI